MRPSSCEYSRSALHASNITHPTQHTYVILQSCVNMMIIAATKLCGHLVGTLTLHWRALDRFTYNIFDTHLLCTSNVVFPAPKWSFHCLLSSSVWLFIFVSVDIGWWGGGYVLGLRMRAWNSFCWACEYIYPGASRLWMFHTHILLCTSNVVFPAPGCSFHCLLSSSAFAIYIKLRVLFSVSVWGTCE